jgi:hypothetical protein
MFILTTLLAAIFTAPAHAQTYEATVIPSIQPAGYDVSAQRLNDRQQTFSAVVMRPYISRCRPKAHVPCGREGLQTVEIYSLDYVQLACIDKQLVEVRKAQKDQTLIDFLRVLEVQNIAVELRDNTGGPAEIDNALNYGMAIDGGTFRLRPMINSKGDCVLVTAEKLREQFAEWRTDFADLLARLEPSNQKLASIKENADAVLKSIRTTEPERRARKARSEKVRAD